MYQMKKLLNFADKAASLPFGMHKWAGDDCAHAIMQRGL
jgi:hypothetical protein